MTAYKNKDDLLDGMTLKELAGEIKFPPGGNMEPEEVKSPESGDLEPEPEIQEAEIVL